MQSGDVAAPATLWKPSRTTVRDVLSRGKAGIGEVITCCGWIRQARSSKGVVFVMLNDGSTPLNLQMVFDEANLTLDTSDGGVDLATVRRMTVAWSLKVKGEIIESPAKGQDVELRPLQVIVLGEVEDPASYPLGGKKITLDFLRQHPHLRVRTNTIGAVARIRNTLAWATHSFFQERDFVYVHTPILTGTDCEGAGEMMQVTTLLKGKAANEIPAVKGDAGHAIDYSQDFFGQAAFLTVSGQLNVETYACALSNVYTFGPTFRAEKSDTNRHLAEFWMIEPEIAFADMSDNMALAEDYLKHCVHAVLTRNADDVDLLNRWQSKGLRGRLEALLASPFHRMTYTEAVELLLQHEADGKVKFDKAVGKWGVDLGSEHEKYLTDQVFKKTIIVRDYPACIKAFYMKLNADGKTVQAMDILVPGIGEVIGGSVREDDITKLEAMCAQKKMDAEALKFYFDLRRYGSVPHAGFGLGFERLIMLCTGISNIRDVIAFPRYPGHCHD